MPARTYYVIQALTDRNGAFAMDRPRQAPTETAARQLAEELSRTKLGVFAFSRTADVELGEYGDPVIIARHGEIPPRFIELLEEGRAPD